METEWLVKVKAKTNQREGEYVSIYPSTIKKELHKIFVLPQQEKFLLSIQESNRISKLLK